MDTSQGGRKLDQRLDEVAARYADFAAQAGAGVPDLPRTRRQADRVITLASVDSTNILARELITDGLLPVTKDGKPTMTAMCADMQSAGHGRLGRKWSEQPDGASFLVSFVTSLPKVLATDPRCNGWFTMEAGLAAIDALNGTLDECGAVPFDAAHHLELKWPNDIFCHGRKLGGILAELVELPQDTDGAGRYIQLGSTESHRDCALVPSEALPRSAGQSPDDCVRLHPGVQGDSTGRPSCMGQPNPATRQMRTGADSLPSRVVTASAVEPAVGVIFGIGMNLGLDPDRLPTAIATSLQLLYRPLPDPQTVRDMVASRLTASLRLRLAAFLADRQAALDAALDETRAICWTLGRQVEAKFTDGSVLRGKAVALNADASLTVEDEAGTRHIVRTADVGVLA